MQRDSRRWMIVALLLVCAGAARADEQDVRERFRLSAPPGYSVQAATFSPDSRALAYLQATQREDGSWPQNMTVEGKACLRGLELDQVAFPILLCWRLGVAGGLEHDPYDRMVRRAAACLLARGPSTPLDRWENAGGLSPSR